MRVIIIDDHAFFRIGVRQILEFSAECRVVGEASTALDGIALIANERPDVVLMDLALPGMDGVAAIQEIGRRGLRARVLIMSAYDQIYDVLDALNAGAAGYALKSDGPETLVRALRLVARGERYLAPAVANRVVVYESRRRRAREVLEVLSDREREVFHLAADCLLTREIARELHISRKTVDTHLFRIHRKLGLRSSAELVRLAASLGTSSTDDGRPRPETTAIETDL